jgi:hypothetical protein
MIWIVELMRATWIWLVVISCRDGAEVPPPPAAPPVHAPRSPAPTPAPALRTVTVARSAFRVGERIVTKEHHTLATRKDAPSTLKIVIDRERTLEILAVDGAAITRAAVTYQRDAVTKEVNGVPQPATVALVGTTYRAQLRAGEVVFTTDPPRALQGEEEQRLADDLRGAIGVPDPILEAMARAPMDVGSARPIAAAALAPAYGPTARIDDAAIRLLAARGGVARVEQIVRFRDRYAGTARAEVEIDLAISRRRFERGTTLVHVDGAVVDVESTCRYDYR